MNTGESCQRAVGQHIDRWRPLTGISLLWAAFYAGDARSKQGAVTLLAAAGTIFAAGALFAIQSVSQARNPRAA